MSIICIPDEAKEILGYIREMGSITDAQLDLLLGDNRKNREFYIRSLKIKYIREEDGRYYAKAQKSTFDRATDICCWVVLDNYRNSDGSAVNVHKSANPGTVTFLKDDVLYQVIYVDRNRKSVIRMLENEYLEKLKAGKKHDIPEYVFAISKEEHLEIFHELQLRMPHTIACVLQNTDSKMPIIDYYSSGE